MDDTEIVAAAARLAGITDARLLQEELSRQPGLLAPEVDGLLTLALHRTRGHPDMGQAIDSFEGMLERIDPQRHLLERAFILHTLGTLYCRWPEGDRAENLDRAKIYYEVALCIYDRVRSENPAPWAHTRIGLSNAYLWRLRGDPAENIEQAIEGYQAAQEVWSRASSSETWSEVEYSLAVAYRLRHRGSHLGNVEQGIRHALNALAHFQEGTFPRQWATVMSELATLYSQRVRGDRGQNLETAISHYASALKVLTPRESPLQWARAQDGLGRALVDRQVGEPADNLDEAIEHFRLALQLRTREQDPAAWAETMHNLGTAYAARWARGQAPAVARAARCYIAALSVRKPDTLSAGARQTGRDLGQLYFKLRRWSLARDAFAIALQGAERLYRASCSWPGTGAELAGNASLYRDAAYTAARLDDPARAFLILEQGPTHLLAEALRLRITRPAGVGNRAWQAFEDAAAGIRASAQRGAMPPGGDLMDSLAPSRQAQAAKEAGDALARAIDRVRVEAPGFLQHPDPASIRSLLPDEHTALVAFSITPQGSTGLVVHRWQQDAVQVVDIPAFTRRTLDTLLFGPDSSGDSPGGWVRAYQRRTPAEWRALMVRVLAEVGQKLLAPILDVVPPNIEHLVLLPSGGLGLLPLHAVPLSKDGTGRVLDRFLVTYAPSAGALSSLPAPEIPPKRHGLIATVHRRDAGQPKLASLESIIVGRLLTRCQHLEDADATRQEFARESRGRAYLHFAGPCHYDWDDPRQSGLRLVDGDLTLAELERGRLGPSSEGSTPSGAPDGEVDLSAARLLTLSACEAGLVDAGLDRDADYLFLPASLIRAGVPCVVNSLWRVEGLSAILLLERFYRNHLQEKLSPGIALHEAQSWMCTRLTQRMVLERIEGWQELCTKAGRQDLSQQLEDEKARLSSGDGRDPDDRPYTHPYYWAAFAVTGR